MTYDTIFSFSLPSQKYPVFSTYWSVEMIKNVIVYPVNGSE